MQEAASQHDVQRYYGENPHHWPLSSRATVS
jgi:hypothetical protein